jgi:hypothetical protein
MMKNIKVLLLVVSVIGMNISCSSQTQKDEKSAEVTKVDKVEVYYFHFTRRCATCNAVESVSKDAIAELYGDNVIFKGYNLDEKDGEVRGQELDISGQTLLIVAGDSKIDITTEGFMNARSNPDKLKAIIKEKIDPLL